MARFIATCRGRARSEASRLGSVNSPVSATARGWHVGGRVDAMARDLGDDQPGDYVSLGLTCGSTGDGQPMELGTWCRNGEGYHPADERARVILKAIRAQEKREAKAGAA